MVKFNEYVDLYQYLLAMSPELKNGNCTSREKCYNNLEIRLQRLLRQLKTDSSSVDKSSSEIRIILWFMLQSRWNTIKSPYYEIYPSIIDTFSRTSIDFESGWLDPPQNLETILLKFPVGSKQSWSLFSLMDEPDRKRKALSMVTYVKEKIISLSIALPYTTSIKDAVNAYASKAMDMEIHGGFSVKDAINLVKIYVSLCLIGEDPEFVEPLILNADMANRGNKDLKSLAEKAKKRGKFGFSIGRTIEVCPHTRHPHLAWIRIGKGRQDKKLIKRKGSIVHKNKVVQVPTGFEGEECTKKKQEQPEK